MTIYNENGQYEQKSLNAAIKKMKALYHSTAGCYALEGGYIVAKSYSGKGPALWKCSSHEIQRDLGNNLVVWDKRCNYFFAMRNYIKKEKVVLVMGAVYTWRTYKSLNLRPYSIMFDGKKFSYNPYYEHDGDVDVRLIIPT